MIKKCKFFLLFFLLSINNGISQEDLCNIIEKVNLFNQNYRKLKLFKDSNNLKEYLKVQAEMEKTIEDMRSSKDISNIITSSKNKRPVSYYYTMTKYYLTLYNYSNLVQRGDSCTTCYAKLCSTYKISLGKDKEMSPEILYKKIYDLSSTPEDKQVFETCILYPDSALELNKIHIQTIDYLSDKCKKSPPWKKRPSIIDKSIKQDSTNSAILKGGINDDKIENYLNHSSGKTVEHFFQKHLKEAEKYPKYNPRITIFAESFGEYGENKKIDITCWYRGDSAFVTEKNRIGLGKYQDTTTHLALAIITATLKDLYDSLNTNFTKVKAQIIGYADGYKVGYSLFYEGEMGDIVNIPYYSLDRNHKKLEANFDHIRDTIHNNTELAFLRSYYALQTLSGDSIIAKDSAILYSDTISEYGDEYRKITIIIFLYGANSHELDQFNPDEMKIIKERNQEKNIKQNIPFKHPDRNTINGNSGKPSILPATLNSEKKKKTNPK